MKVVYLDSSILWVQIVLVLRAKKLRWLNMMIKDLIVLVLSATLLLGFSGCQSERGHSDIKSDLGIMVLHELAPVLELPLLKKGFDSTVTSNSVGVKGVPLQYAVPVAKELDVIPDGQWRQIAEDRWRWHIDLYSPGAQSLDIELSNFYLPPNSHLTLYNEDKSVSQGPFTANLNTQGSLWLPKILGEHVIMEVVINDYSETIADGKTLGDIPFTFILARVDYGFR